MPWLAKADPIAALFVACIVVYVSSRLARQTIDTLLDAAPAGVRNRIIEEVYRVDGVLEVDRVRIRRSGSRYFADVSIAMSRNVTFQKSEQVANEVALAHSRAAAGCRRGGQRRGAGQPPGKPLRPHSRRGHAQQSQRARHQRAGHRRQAARGAACGTRRAAQPEGSARSRHPAGSGDEAGCAARSPTS